MCGGGGQGYGKGITFSGSVFAGSEPRSREWLRIVCCSAWRYAPLWSCLQSCEADPAKYRQVDLGEGVESLALVVRLREGTKSLAQVVRRGEGTEPLALVVGSWRRY